MKLIKVQQSVDYLSFISVTFESHEICFLAVILDIK